MAEPLIEGYSDKDEDDLGDDGSNIFGYAKLMKEKERQKLVGVELILRENHIKIWFSSKKKMMKRRLRLK